MILPDDIEYGRQDKLVVNSDGHVARLMEGRGYGPDCVTQVHRPHQEEELSCEDRERTNHFHPGPEKARVARAARSQFNVLIVAVDTLMYRKGLVQKERSNALLAAVAVFSGHLMNPCAPPWQPCVMLPRHPAPLQQTHCSFPQDPIAIILTYCLK